MGCSTGRQDKPKTAENAPKKRQSQSAAAAAALQVEKEQKEEREAQEKAEFEALCDRNELARIFREHDVDGSGGISRYELSEALKDAGLDMDKHSVKRLFATFDVDQNGFFQFQEFEKLVGTYQVLEEFLQPLPQGSAGQEAPRRSVNNKLVTVFIKYDTDNSGNISRKELWNALRDVGIQLQFKEVQLILAQFDGNKDGLLCLEEFERMVNASEALADIWGGVVAESDYDADIDELGQVGRTLGIVRERDIEKIFHIYDANGSGAIDARELKKALDLAGVDIRYTSIKELLTKFDFNKSGVIEYNEFKQLITAFDKLKKYADDCVRAKEKLPNIFKAHDIDQSGCISKEELKLALFEAGVDASKSKIKKIMNQFDADNSGGICYDEFKKLVESYHVLTEDKDTTFLEPATIRVVFQELDKDGSGTMDMDELQHAFKLSGLQLNQKALKTLMSKFDDDKSRRISMDEFAKIASTYNDLLTVFHQKGVRASAIARDC